MKQTFDPSKKFNFENLKAGDRVLHQAAGFGTLVSDSDGAFNVLFDDGEYYFYQFRPLFSLSFYHQYFNHAEEPQKDHTGMTNLDLILQPKASIEKTDELNKNKIEEKGRVIHNLKNALSQAIQIIERGTYHLSEAPKIEERLKEFQALIQREK